jgi:hypothetical protein
VSGKSRGAPFANAEISGGPDQRGAKAIICFSNGGG